MSDPKFSPLVLPPPDLCTHGRNELSAGQYRYQGLVTDNVWLLLRARVARRYSRRCRCGFDRWFW